MGGSDCIPLGDPSGCLPVYTIKNYAYDSVLPYSYMCEWGYWVFMGKHIQKCFTADVNKIVVVRYLNYKDSCTLLRWFKAILTLFQVKLNTELGHSLRYLGDVGSLGINSEKYETTTDLVASPSSVDQRYSQKRPLPWTLTLKPRPGNICHIPPSPTTTSTCNELRNHIDFKINSHFYFVGHICWSSLRIMVHVWWQKAWQKSSKYIYFIN